MTKLEAIELFGTQRDLQIGLGLSRRTFYGWPDPLPQDKIDRIRGAYMRVVEERDRRYTWTIGWAIKKGLEHEEQTP